MAKETGWLASTKVDGSMLDCFGLFQTGFPAA